jgi:hypothetical protein
MYFTGRMMEAQEARGHDRDGIFFVVDMGKVLKMFVYVVSKVLVSYLQRFHKNRMDVSPRA